MLAIGVIGVLAFAGMAAAGRADLPPFALAFLASAVSEAVITRAGSRWDSVLDWRTAGEILVALAAFAALALGALRAMADPGSWDGQMSLLLGLSSGNFITDALVRRRWWKLQGERP
jgi:hypothetical protein